MFFWTKRIDRSDFVLLRLSSSGLLSSPQVVPVVPGWCATEKAAAPSSATTANRPGIPTRRVTLLASRGRNPSTPTATIRPATHKSRGQVSVLDLNQSSVVLVTTVVAEFTFTDALKPVYGTATSPLLPFADVLASLQAFFLHQSWPHQHSPSVPADADASVCLTSCRPWG